MNYCGDCGNKLEKNIKFCGNCGLKLSDNDNSEFESKIISKVNHPELENIKKENQSPKIENEKKESNNLTNKELSNNLKNFNRKQPLYQQIRWTLIALWWIQFFVEFIFQEGDRIDGYRNTINVPRIIFLTFITFFIARTIMRTQFIKDPNFKNKIIITIGVFIGVFIIQKLITLLIISLIL